MNTPILARLNARVGERNVGSRTQREQSRELSSPRTESWRAKLLGAAFAALILASVILLSSRVGEASNAGGNGALLHPAGSLTGVAGAHVGSTTHRDTSGADETKTHGPLIASRHKAWRSNRAG
jgi:hypothetical protein